MATLATAAVLLGVFVVQCLGSMRLKSPTFDEPIYLAAGYVSVTTDEDLNPAHPPLMKYLFAVPLALVGASPVTEIPHWNEATLKPRTFGVSFLFENRVDADTLLFAGRSAVVLVAVLLGVLVAAWAQQLYGSAAGLVALGLYVFCPNVIAHSTVATLDLGVTAGITAASFAFWRAYTRPSWQAGAVAGVALAVALLMKATALLLLGLLPVQLGAAILWHRRRDAATMAAAAPPPRAPRAKRPTAPVVAGSRTRQLLVATTVALAVTVALITVAYGPGHFGITTYVDSFRQGFLNRAAYMNQSYETFCWGRYSDSGFRWYFLAAFILKTPIPTLLATVATMVWLARRPLTCLFDEIFLILPIVAFFVATAFTRDNLGLRYILPVYPLLYVLIAGMAVAVLRWTRNHLTAGDWRAHLATGGAGALVLAYVGGTLAIYPNHLAYFNGLFCGPGEGIRYLDDSNIDWGQDYKQLARYLREHDITDAKGLYFPYHLNAAVSRYYGLTLPPPTWAEVRNPTPGWYAISAHILQRPALAHDPAFGAVHFDWLTRYEPVAKIGYSIYLYHFP